MGRVAVVPQHPEVVAHPQRVVAHQAGQGRLDRVDVGRALVSHRVAEVGVGVGVGRELEPRDVGRVAEEGGGARREAQALGVETALVLADVRLVEAREPHAEVDERRGRARVHVVVGEGVVDPEEVVPGRPDAVQLSRPVAPVLPPVVPGVADEEAVAVGELVVDPRGDRVEGVAAPVGPDEVVAALRVAGLVGQGVEVQVGEGHRAQPVGRDHVAREGRALDPPVGKADRSQRVVDGDALAEQGREVPLPLGLRGDGERPGLRKLVLEPLVGDHEERPVPSAVSRQQDRPAQRPAVTVVAQRRPWLARAVQEEVVGGDGVGPVELVGGAVPVVGPALEDHVDRGSRGVALLRVVGRRLDLELLHRVGRGDVGHAPAVGHVGRAVERELVSAVGAGGAVGDERGRPRVVEGPGELQVPDVGGAGGEA